jgi:hypothetical protein
MKYLRLLPAAFYAIAVTGAATRSPPAPFVSSSVDSQDLGAAPGPIAMLLCGAGLLGLGLIGRRRPQVIGDRLRKFRSRV